MFPPKPDFKPLNSNALRQATFGPMEYTAAPIKGNLEHISLKGSWAKSKHKLEYDYSLINTKIYFNAFIPSVIKITY